MNQPEAFPFRRLHTAAGPAMVCPTIGRIFSFAPGLCLATVDHTPSFLRENTVTGCFEKVLADSRAGCANRDPLDPRRFLAWCNLGGSAETTTRQTGMA
jgi:hypothetical protein